MQEVTAHYKDGESLTFFEGWTDSKYADDCVEHTAMLVHPRQEKPIRVEAKRALVDRTWHFYSVSFSYSVPDKARPKHLIAGGMHISFSHDEEEASKRLSAAMNTVHAAASRAQLRYMSQYAWPDGSLYYWFVSRNALEDFKKDDLQRLTQELESVMDRPFTVRRYYPDYTDKGKEKKRKKSFDHKYGESHVKVQEVHEVTNPLRDAHKAWCLNLVDFFNGQRYDGSVDQTGKTLAVSVKEANAFREGMEVAYGHQDLFTPYLERYAENEVGSFGSAYHMAKLLQLLTE